MLVWRMAWREMRQHVGRTLLTLLSVVIGVASVLAVGLATNSSRQAYREMFQTITGTVDLEVTGSGGQAMPASLLQQIQENPGVRLAVPLIQRPVIMYHATGRLKLMALGVDPALDHIVRNFKLVAGKSLGEARGILLDSSLAESLNLHPGDPVRILAPRGRIHTQIIGLVRPQSGLAAAMGGVLFMPLAAAQRYFAARDKLDRIQVLVNEDATPEAVRDQLIKRIGEGVQVEQPSTRSPMAEQTMLAVENGLRMATSFSLLSAVFIIMNTFLMSVGQRRRQLAVMRAIGATRSQISALVLRESLLLAAVGTVLGLGIGWAGADQLNEGMGSLFQTTLPPVQIRLLPVVLATLFGLGISLLGAAVPAREAARLSPLEGMTGIAKEEVADYSHWLVRAGMVVVVAWTAVLLASIQRWLPPDFCVIATVNILVGLVMLLPAALRPFTRWSAGLLQGWARFESRLARLQLLRHRIRTTLTIGVLFIAAATGLGLSSAILDNVADVRSWYRSVIAGDFFVRASMPDMHSGQSVALPDSLGDQLKQIEGIERLGSVRLVSTKVEGHSALVVATEYLIEKQTAGERGTLPFAPPKGDSVLIGSVLAQRLGRKAGDTITLDTLQGPKTLPIQSVYNDYTASGLTIHMNLDLGRRLLGIQGVDAYIIKTSDSMRSQVEAAVRSLCAREGLLMQSYAELTGMIESMMAGLVGSLWGLVVLGLIVAAIGIVNTLSMNVLEQTREWGLLRVVGMTRGQVRRAVLAQAAMMGIIGIVPGLAAGVAMAYLINFATLPSIGHPVAFHWPWQLLGFGFAAAITIVLIAAWVPAERAARMSSALALRYQ